MKIYLKGYYWYKNFWDELLLFGVIVYLYETYKYTTLYIEALHSSWLQDRLEKHKTLLPWWWLQDIILVPKRANITLSRDLTVFWWWEVVTDARGFPYNWWTYIFWFLRTIITGKYILLWWIGTIKQKATPLLYSLFLKRATYIRVRDAWSFEIAKKYNSQTLLERDFAYDILDGLQIKRTTSNNTIIINCNPYIWSKETKKIIIDYAKGFEDKRLLYVPAEIWCDDIYYEELKKSLPALELYDWTLSPLEHTFSLFANSDWWIWARLHVLLLLDYYKIPYKPLIYQEKIKKVLLDK